MTMNNDGTADCDRCGASVGNGGVRMAVVVSDLDPDNPGHVRTLHFCRDRNEQDGTETKGCARKLLSAANLSHYRESHDSTSSPVAGPSDPIDGDSGGAPDITEP